MKKAGAVSNHEICKLLLKKFVFNIYKNVKPKRNRRSKARRKQKNAELPREMLMKEIERLKILIEDDEKITCKRKTERIKYRNRKNRKSRKARNRKKRYGKRKTRIRDNNRSKNRRAREIKITKTKKTKTLERQEVKRIAKEFH